MADHTFELLTPLTNDHFNHLIAGEEKCGEALALCEKCARCGMEVEPQAETARIMRDRLQAIRTEFFPNGLLQN